jgi:hypothetical protein
MKDDPVIGHCKFADGAMRPIYDDGRRQYVIDNDGFPVYGVWLIPEEVPLAPLIVRADEDNSEENDRAPRARICQRRIRRSLGHIGIPWNETRIRYRPGLA